MEKVASLKFSIRVFGSVYGSGSQILQRLPAFDSSENSLDPPHCGDFCGDAVSQCWAIFQLERWPRRFCRR